jgi:hypothetical protein
MAVGELSNYNEPSDYTIQCASCSSRPSSKPSSWKQADRSRLSDYTKPAMTSCRASKKSVWPCKIIIRRHISYEMREETGRSSADARPVLSHFHDTDESNDARPILELFNPDESKRTEKMLELAILNLFRLR